MTRDRRPLLELLDGVIRDAHELRARLAELDVPDTPDDPDVVARCRTWLEGVGWDESFSAGMIEANLQRIARLAGFGRLEPGDVRALLERWHELRLERYAACPACGRPTVHDPERDWRVCVSREHAVDGEGRVHEVEPHPDRPDDPVAATWRRPADANAGDEAAP